MFSVYYVCSRSDVTRTCNIKDTGSSTRAPYISPPTMVANRICRLCWSVQYSPKKLRRRLKLASGLAKMPYYIEACLMQSPYFVTLAALLARTVQIIF